MTSHFHTPITPPPTHNTPCEHPRYKGSSGAIPEPTSKTPRECMRCSNCQTTSTPLWRRDGHGNAICNACGLYYKLHRVHRPATLRRTTVKRRKRSRAIRFVPAVKEVPLAARPRYRHDHASSSVAPKWSGIRDSCVKPEPTDQNQELLRLWQRRERLRQYIEHLYDLLSSSTDMLSRLEQAMEQTYQNPLSSPPAESISSPELRPSPLSHQHLPILPKLSPNRISASPKLVTIPSISQILHPNYRNLHQHS